MNPTTLAYVELIKSCGYRVFMRNPNDEYCFYTDGTQIGYAQWSRDLRTGVTSVHKPNTSTGTGFGCGDRITPETLKLALDTFCPSWSSNCSTVKKYKDWAEFHNASDWNRQLQEV